MSQSICESDSKKFTKTQWLLIGFFVLSNLCGGLIYSALAAFYPAEATKKGISSTVVGFVIGIFELINFLLAPVFGVYMKKFGAKTTLVFGILLMSTTTILFSFVDKLDNQMWFITSSFTARILQAIGASAIMTASYTIVAMEFQHSVPTVFGMMETSFAFGMCIGPSVGAGLFQAGGFLLAFGALGCFILATTPISMFALRKAGLKADSVGLTINKEGVLPLLKIFPVSLAVSANAINTFCLGTFTVLLEPYLRQFNIGTFGTALMFLLHGAAIATSSLVWGVICGRVREPFYVVLSGGVFFFVGFCTVGPAPFIPTEPLLVLTAAGLTFTGIGAGAITVSSFAIAMNKAKENGFPDALETYSIVSGIWTSSFALGAFAGPSLAGILFDLIGFRNQNAVILGILSILIVTIVVYIWMGKDMFPENKQVSLSAHGSA